MSQSSAFHLLDERIQRYLWAEQWESLRDAQEASIPRIINADRDVIVAAATAAGKTEAAFLPALTHVLQSDSPRLILYISPLKALINDQFGRLERLCEQLAIPVWPWHGDITATSKKRFLTKPGGVLLITPESVEALLCNRGTAVKAIFDNLAYIVVDELHAFLGSERGKQLQSLMHRIERAIGRTVPRIGLSATLGDMALAAEFLRPGGGDSVDIVNSASAGAELRVLVKGFEEPAIVRGASPGEEPPEPIAPRQIAGQLFSALRGSNNLIFPNSRREVERYTHLLNELCETNRVPKEFWPHHGSLSKEIRAETEEALKQKERPASAICTNTLELGIDIGAVKSVAQIGPPPSVASLRQRLGRSGRRKGEPAILRGFSVEEALSDKASLSTMLRLDAVRLIAMISLLIEGWFEPPPARSSHYSTLVQQVLSHVSQNGGASIGQLYSLLCADGAPFESVSKSEFVALMREMGTKELLTQDSSGLLLHGRIGEKFVNHYTFYAAFATEEEYRIASGSKTLGTMPVSQGMVPGQRILFAGKTWTIEDVDESLKTVFVVPAKGGVPPLFDGGGGKTHTCVRQRMRELLQSTDALIFLDATATRFLQEGRAAYSAMGLVNVQCLDQGQEFLLLTWLGDAANEALASLLCARGLFAQAAGPGVEVIKRGVKLEQVHAALRAIASEEIPLLPVLLPDTERLLREKWDWALPVDLLRKGFVTTNFSLDEARDWAAQVAAGN